MGEQKYRIKPTVTFTTKQNAQKVFEAVMKCFDELDPEMCGPIFLPKNLSEHYVVSWDEYMGTNYVCVKIIKKIEQKEQFL
jgi:hypothetical protein